MFESTSSRVVPLPRIGLGTWWKWHMILRQRGGVHAPHVEESNKSCCSSKDEQPRRPHREETHNDAIGGTDTLCDVFDTALATVRDEESANADARQGGVNQVQERPLTPQPPLTPRQTRLASKASRCDETVNRRQPLLPGKSVRAQTHLLQKDTQREEQRVHPRRGAQQYRERHASPTKTQPTTWPASDCIES